jgi:AcrR family transcriptional regulator
VKRANDDAQKSQRRDEILNQAATLLAKRDFEAVTLSEVAGNLGLVKGTLYRYFPTKEVLVLEVLERELQLWLTDLSGALLPGELGVQTLVDHLTQSLGARPLLVRLFSIVHVQLEKHLSLERLVEFKKSTALVMNRAASLIEAASPPLAGKGTNAVLALYELAIGVGHVTERSPLVEQALTDPVLEVFRLEFVPALRESLLWTFTGLAATGSSGSK